MKEYINIAFWFPESFDQSLSALPREACKYNNKESKKEMCSTPLQFKHEHEIFLKSKAPAYLWDFQKFNMIIFFVKIFFSF